MKLVHENRRPMEVERSMKEIEQEKTETTEKSTEIYGDSIALTFDKQTHHGCHIDANMFESLRFLLFKTV